MAKKIDWNSITVHTAHGMRQQAAVDQLAAVGEDFEITDALAHPGEGGLLMLQIINGNVDGQNTARDQATEVVYRKRYHLRVLKREDGSKVKPGDEIEWRVGRRLRDALGKKITSRKIKELQRRGEIRSIETWHSATVDDHGCITVSFEDAIMLLDLRGVHYVSKGPLTGMPAMAGKTHCWLYEEVPEAEYAKLSKPKRGRPPKAHATPNENPGS